jgi:very-short-patch-repair endonuclease
MKEHLASEGARPRDIHLSVLGSSARSRIGVRVYRRGELPAEDRAVRDRIPVTSPARTLIDLGSRLSERQLEAAVNEADRLALVDPESLRSAVDDHSGCRGVSTLRKLLDRRTFALTDSELERRFIRLVVRAGLRRPLTQKRVNGFRVDFYWPELGLIVETDGLRYHRTSTQQARDRQRDQAHTAAGLTPLRFTHAQVAFEPARVVDVLRVVAERCRLRIVGLPG